MYTQMSKKMGINQAKVEVIPIQEFQSNFEDYIKQIEENKKSFIIESEDGTRAVMIPIDDELVKIHTEMNNDAP